MNKIIFCALALLPFGVSAQQQYQISGKVGNLQSPAKAYLSYRVGGTNQLDSADVNAGSFMFNGDVESPSAATLILAHKGESIREIEQPDLLSLYLEDGKTEVSAKDSLKNAVLSGTPLNKDQSVLNSALKSVNKEESALMSFYYHASDEERKSEEFQKTLEEKYNAIQKNKDVILAGFIENNPKSLVSLFTLRSAVDPGRDYNKAVTLFDMLDEEIKGSALGEEYSSLLQSAESTSIGAKAPEFTMNDTEDKPIALSSFKGKYVLIDFWASWCGPCRAENPNVVKAYETFKDKNFTILGVSLDRSNAKDAWVKAIADDHLAWTQVSDLQFWNNAAAKLYGVRGIPANFLIDPDGKIVAKNLRGADLEAKLAEMLN